jgi:hypothetical protein
VAFGFHANVICADKLCRRLSFTDRNAHSGEHYFIMDRSEETPEVAVPDLENIFIERDDQQWGGYGGIQRVILERKSLTLHLGPRMAIQMGEHDSIRISFAANDDEFCELRQVLGLIMKGYESQLEFLV